MSLAFYVEVWQPTGDKAEAYAEFVDFSAAVAWLESKRAEDATRIPRLFGHTNGEQHEAMLLRGFQPG